MMRKIGLLGWCVVVVSIAFWWALNPQTKQPAPAPAPRSTSVPAPVIGPDRPALHPRDPATLPPQPRSPLGDSLHSPDHSPERDLEIVLRLMQRYRESFQGFPAGEDNRQIINALTGNNPGGLAILPRNHPAVSRGGELLDRWGTPYFFHLVDRNRLEIISAGPDHERGTPDDLSLASGR